MALGNVSETALAKLIFQNIAMANIGNAGGLQPSGAAGSLYVALHTANPGATGNQSTSEAAYSGYARVAVVRSAGGWTVAANQPAVVSNAGAVTFPQSANGPETETYFSIGTDPSGAGQILVWGSLTAPLTVTAGIIPSFSIGNLTTSVS